MYNNDILTACNNAAFSSFDSFGLLDAIQLIKALLHGGQGK
jgi:hypothetical protein